jgi:endonuclease/exonuclease/phosphatase family metal-dependent hydrolase
MSWNLRSLRDDGQAVVRVLRACTPDVLFVQEAPRFLRAASRLAAVARESGLVVAGAGRPMFGVALLTTMRIEVGAPSMRRLSHTPGLHRRGVAMATLALGERRFVAASLHLGLDAAERQRHVAEIERMLGRAPGASVVAGDFNEQSSGAAWGALASGRQDAGGAPNWPTFPARGPQRRIDAVLTPPAWTVAPVSPLEIADESDLLAATDHRPAIVDVMG